jgi:hypothetical protein
MHAGPLPRPAPDNPGPPPTAPQVARDPDFADLDADLCALPASIKLPYKEQVLQLQGLRDLQVGGGSPNSRSSRAVLR